MATQISNGVNLVIVESPTKAKTIEQFLDKKSYTIRSSFGHIRDLPKKDLGVDIEHNFKPKYIIPTTAKKKAADLKKESQKAENIILATDEDREGEAIAWHIAQILNLDKSKNYQRIAFHEITKKAVEEALTHPRQIDINLVNAQQARRVLDRLVGYKLSPFLWKKIAKGLSAGRVQSVAVRLIVSREDEINNFKSQEYWTLTALLNSKDKPDNPFEAHLTKINDKTLTKLALENKKEVEEIIQDLSNASYQILSIQKKDVHQSPLPPFKTSTLQQEAWRRFGFSAKQTMRLAQQLYEGIKIGSEGQIGLISYMRTDSLSLSQDTLQQAQKIITKKFGADYALPRPKIYKTKSRGAQEAHEAIRPTDLSREPEQIKSYLDIRQYKLYNLIWQRTLACQMPAAILEATAAEISAQGKKQKYIFKTTGSIIKFDGFLKIYPKKITEKTLPNLQKDENLELLKLTPLQHFTQPPARYSEATLIKTLEEFGIGRPSTYAPILSAIQERGYVEKNQDKKLAPTEIGTLVNNLLIKHFPEIIDLGFTAKMETDLDKIAKGQEQWTLIIKKFYTPFERNLKMKEKEVKKIIQETEEKCPECGANLVIRFSRAGKFYGCSAFPQCHYTKNIDNNSDAPEKTDEICEKCGAPMRIKQSKFGKFLGCSAYPQCKNIKSLAKSLNIHCPICQKGEIVEKKSRRGKIFYACNQYPDCDFALWDKPTGEKCSQCDSLLVEKKNKKIKCSKCEK